MKDLRQIQLISSALTKEKDKYLHELARTTASIEKKVALINRMMTYQNEYSNSANLQLSRSVPALNKNLQAFSKTVSDVIDQANMELTAIKKKADALSLSIEKIDNKIKLMKTFEDQIRHEAVSKTNRCEQTVLDDLTSTQRIRGNHE